MIYTRFHSFVMGDVEDPEIYMASPIHEWQQTEMGRWVMQNAKDPRYNMQWDLYNYGHKVIISGMLSESDHTFFMLKWGHLTDE